MSSRIGRLSPVLPGSVLLLLAAALGCNVMTGRFAPMTSTKLR
jgi:hypothetical protein